MEKDRIDILLKEYEICQHDSSAMVNIQWTVAGIFMAINTALLGWILSNIISDDKSLEGNKCLVLAFGVGIILIFILLWQWLERVSFLVRINNNRMSMLENQLGMWKNRLVEICDDHWKDLTEEEKKRFTGSKCKVARLHGIWFARLIYIILGLLWIFFIIFAWWPSIRQLICGN